MAQMRLAWPRGQKEVTCGHGTHYAMGLCVACYHKGYRRRVKEYTDARVNATSAPRELTCYNRDDRGSCLGHPHSSSPTGTVYHDE